LDLLPDELALKARNFYVSIPPFLMQYLKGEICWIGIDFVGWRGAFVVLFLGRYPLKFNIVRLRSVVLIVEPSIHCCSFRILYHMFSPTQIAS
jgi:hypothetical protein